MTRLTSEDIHAVCSGLPGYDHDLQEATGRSLLEIGAAAGAITDIRALRRQAPSIKMAVVPVRGGLGIIGGFSEAVGGILTYLGFDARVTRHTDVAGFAEAVESGTRVILAADDDRFVAFCPQQSALADNAECTARGYVAGFEFMAGGLAGKPVLVMGCGPVGRCAVRALLSHGARVCVIDRLAAKADELVRWAVADLRSTVRLAADLEQALADHDLIFDATNAADIIHSRHVTARTRIAAPGMPCGVTENARRRLTGRLLHDPLQIGVAAMACEAVHLIGQARPADRHGEGS